MSLATRLRRLESFKFCPLCGADWQEQQQENRANQKRAAERLQNIMREHDVKDKQEFLREVKENCPFLWFQFSYDPTKRLGWSKEDVPSGHCSACGKDLLPPEERRQENAQRASERVRTHISRLMAEKGWDEETAIAYVREIAPTLAEDAGLS